jgi:signal transduction histidine kinase
MGMRLSEFIRRDLPRIVADWEEFAGTLPAGAAMSREQLRDEAAAILMHIAANMDEAQTDAQQIAKSKGKSDTPASAADSPAQSHALSRLAEGFSLPEVLAEYRALRANVIRKWEASATAKPAEQAEQIVRFSEAIDQAVAESIVRFSQQLDRARELFMGTLGHDLRTPLQVIMQSAKYLEQPDCPEQKRLQMAAFVAKSAEEIHEMVQNLLDVARTKLGRTLPIDPAPADLRELCLRVVAELQMAYPESTLHSDMHGDLRGVWDSARLAQVISNLLKNAIQHGDPGKPIRLAAFAEEERVRLEVHNHGRPIPEQLLSQVFEPLIRGIDRDRDVQTDANMGLGLYIACTIVKAHGGSIVASSSDTGHTIFSVSLPYGRQDEQMRHRA